jgi:hypothetical protein
MRFVWRTPEGSQCAFTDGDNSVAAVEVPVAVDSLALGASVACHLTDHRAQLSRFQQRRSAELLSPPCVRCKMLNLGREDSSPSQSLGSLFLVYFRADDSE